MSGNCGSFNAGEIQWHLLGDNAKIGKASGIKVEYSMSDEIEFAEKLSINMRKNLMRELVKDEEIMYQEELNIIGLMCSNDSTCEVVRNCGRGQIKKEPKYSYDTRQSNNISKLLRSHLD